MSRNGQGKPRRKLASVITLQDPRHPKNQIPFKPKIYPVGDPVWQKRATDRERKLGKGIEIPNPSDAKEHYPRNSFARNIRDDFWRDRWMKQKAHERLIIDANEEAIWDWVNIKIKKHGKDVSFKQLNNWYNQGKVRRGPLRGLRIYKEPGLKRF